jgi:predicted secreted protein
MRRALVAAVAAIVLLPGCSDDGDGTGLVHRDPKRPIDVESGMRFTVEFSVNAGVGFDWELVPPRKDGPVALEETEVDYPDEERDGDSGTKRFVFEAGDPGSEAVVFRKLFRGDTQETRSVTVNVRE